MSEPEAPQQPAPPPGPEAAERPAVLRRSRDDRVIAGVCGGLGRYLGIDPVLLRIAFVVLAVLGGSGVLLYVIAWLVIPEARLGDDVGAPREWEGSPGAFRWLVGGGLVAVGVLLLADEVLPDWVDGKYLWPLALIAIGVAVLTRGARR